MIFSNPGFLQNYTFCYPTVQTAPCYVPSFWHNTGVWRTDRQTDVQTDGIAVASTALSALAMRALRRTIKMLSTSVWLHFSGINDNWAAVASRLVVSTSSHWLRRQACRIPPAYVIIRAATCQALTPYRPAIPDPRRQHYIVESWRPWLFGHVKCRFH